MLAEILGCSHIKQYLSIIIVPLYLGTIIHVFYLVQYTLHTHSDGFENEPMFSHSQRCGPGSGHSVHGFSIICEQASYLLWHIIYRDISSQWDCGLLWNRQELLQAHRWAPAELVLGLLLSHEKNQTRFSASLSWPCSVGLWAKKPTHQLYDSIVNMSWVHEGAFY